MTEAAGSIRLLVVDDDPLVRSALVLMLGAAQAVWDGAAELATPGATYDL